MTTAALTREMRFAVLSVMCASVAVAAIPIAIGGNKKVLAALAAAAAGALIMYLSGNLRLFSLYGYMICLPFDLSKRFGPVIPKMGGETSFRVEMSDPFLLLLAIFLARDIWNGRLPGIRIPKIIWYWIALMWFGIMTAILTDYHLTPLHEVFRMVKMTVLFIVVCNELQRPRQFLHCSLALIIGMIIQACAGLVQKFLGRGLGLEILGESIPKTIQELANSSVQGITVFRISAFMMHPNIFGIFLASLIPLAVAIFLLPVGVLRKTLCLIAVAVGTPALIGTLSRSSWASFAAASAVLLLLLLFHQKLIRRTLLPTAVAVVIVGALLSLYSGQIFSRLFSSQAGATLGRQEYNGDAIRMIYARPVLGFGLNAYVYAVLPYTEYGPREALKVYQGWVPAVHNIYLLWLAETGIIGFTIFMMMWGTVFWTAIHNLKVTNQLLFTVNAACLAANVAFLVDGVFSFSLRVNPICREFWVLAGMVYAIRYWRLRQAAEERTRRNGSGEPAPDVTGDGGGAPWITPGRA